MNPVVRPRARVPYIIALALVLTLLAAGAAALIASGPAGATRHAAASPETILTLRTDGDHDVMWLVSKEGTATAAGSLPGTAEAVAASPDGTYVAYLPFAGKPAIWVSHTWDQVQTIDLQPAGIKTVTDLTWASETQLLVSGTTKAGNQAGFTDKLYTVDVTTGAVASFRGLSGTEPSVSTATGKLVYVKYTKLKPNPKYKKIAHYRESLMLTTLTGTGAGTELDSDEYYQTEDYHAFAAPQLAPAGKWIAFGTTGSDVSVNYHVYFLGDTYWSQWFETWMSTPLALAWAPSSPLLALGGEVVGPDAPAAMYLCDPDGGAMGRTARDLFDKANIEWVMDMDWSEGVDIVVDGFVKQDDSSAAEASRVLLLDSSDLSKRTDLGEGRLSVWVR